MNKVTQASKAQHYESEVSSDRYYCPFSNCMYEGYISSPSSEALVANVAVCCYLIISLLGLNFVLDNFFQWRHSLKQGSEKTEILIRFSPHH